MTSMSESQLYVIELDGYGGDATTIRNLVQCTYTKEGALDVSCRNITAIRRLVRCKECGGRTMSSYDRAKLRAAWNRRADHD